MADHTIYVGTCFGDNDSPTHAILRMSLIDGDLHMVAMNNPHPFGERRINYFRTSTEGINPGWIIPHETGEGKRVLYVVMEDDSGFVQAYSVANKSSSPTPVGGAMPTGGTHPCFASLDATRRWMFVAHYTSGTISVLPMDGAGATQTIQFRATPSRPLLSELADRQEAPHAHCVIPHPSNRWVVACDLGLSTVFSFSFNEQTGILEGGMDDERHYRGDPKDGCRHCCWNKAGTILYVTNELSCTITALSFDTDSGILGKRRVTVPIAGVDLDRSHHRGLSDLVLHPNGRLLFVGCRSTQPSGCIAVFTVEEEPQSDEFFVELKLQGFAVTLGEVPRNFKLIAEDNSEANSGDANDGDVGPSWLVVGNQETKSVECFEVCVNGDGGEGRCNMNDNYNHWSNSLPVTRYLRHTSSISTAPYKPCNIASFDAIYA